MYKVNYATIAGTTVITPEFVEIIKDADTFPASEAVIEYASRLCYNSNEKFGTNPNFIKGLIKAGHLDVLEHGALAMSFNIEYPFHDDDFYKYMYEIKNMFPYFKFNLQEVHSEGAKFCWAGNLRTFLEYGWSRSKLEDNEIAEVTWDYLITALCIVAPNIFENTMLDSHIYSHLQDEYERIYLAEQDVRNDRKRGETTTLTNAIVRPIGFMKIRGLTKHPMRHTAYLINNVSRGFSHQHVRHRLFSISQMSQRYVDYDKQGDGFVYPQNIGLTEKALLDDVFEHIKTTYHALRLDIGMKKEDARVILPNAAITHLVFSSFQEGIDHYVELRTASDAQYEIRQVAELVKKHDRLLPGGIF